MELLLNQIGSEYLKVLFIISIGVIALLLTLRKNKINTKTSALKCKVIDGAGNPLNGVSFSIVYKEGKNESGVTLSGFTNAMGEFTVQLNYTLAPEKHQRFPNNNEAKKTAGLPCQILCQKPGFIAQGHEISLTGKNKEVELTIILEETANSKKLSPKLTELFQLIQN